MFFLGRFLEGYLNIDGAATGAASGVLSAADAPGERHFIKDYKPKTPKHLWTLEILKIVHIGSMAKKEIVRDDGKSA